MPRVTCLTWAVGRGNGRVADEEVEILSAALCTEMSAGSGTTGQEGGLVADGRASRTGASASSGRALGRDGGRKDEGWGVIARETCRILIRGSSRNENAVI